MVNVNSFDLKLVFRLLLPGFILTVALIPVLQTILELAGASQWFEMMFVVLTIFMGWLVVIFDMPIYMAFEGRRFWPNLLSKSFKKLEEKRLQRLWEKLDKAKKNNDRAQELEISVEIRKFPINIYGEYHVLFPTRLGNLITAFEEYSNRIYGLDSVFYWPRIWLKLEKHIQEDVDNQQAMTDSAIYVTVSLYISGVISILYALIQLFNTNWLPNLPDEAALLIMAFCCFLIGYIIYRFSLHLFAQFGETFKSVFDLHHEDVLFEKVVQDIADITMNPDLLTAPDKLKYKIVWRYLHNYRVKLKEDEKSYSPMKLPNREKAQE